MITPPASALLDNRWNRCLDLASGEAVSVAELAAAWAELGPERTLAALRKMTGGGEDIAAREAG